jgi:DNA-directed RNA polymerase subunit RPC12/RpoP
MMLIHIVMICPNCGQEIERFDEEKKGTEIMCTQCGKSFKIGDAVEIEMEW